MGTSLPFFKPLSDEDVKKIDQTARLVLEQVGIKLRNAAILERFKKLGAKVDTQDQRLWLNGELLDELLSRAPSQFTLYSRDGNNDLPVGEGKVHFANGGRVFRILDMATGGYRLTMLRDIAFTARLVNQMDHIRFYVIACQAHDLEPENYHLNDFYYAFNNTTKHVMGGCDNLEGVKQVWDLASFIAGGDDKLREKPFFSVITNPISPLTIGPYASSIIEFCAMKDIPLTCAPAPIAGATSPAAC
jgi:trimethylamine--corrinoid protein Co-methyltransferase